MRTIDVLLRGFFGESNRGFLGIGSAALATVAGTLAVSSSMAQEGQQGDKPQTDRSATDPGPSNKASCRLSQSSTAVPAEVTVEPGLAACPMGSLMGKRPVITVRVLKALEWWHLDRVSGDAVKRTISAVSDGCSQRCEELFRVLDAGDWVSVGAAFA